MSSRADRRSEPAADIVTAHLRLHLASLTEQNTRLHLDKPSAVNKMRIEARRLRSTLMTYRTLFEQGSTEPLRDELRWVGHALGAARDAQVLRVRLAALVAGELIDDRLRRDYLAGRAEGLAALASNRYRGLVQALTEFLDEPPSTARGSRPAGKVLPRAIGKDSQRLERAIRAAEAAPAGVDRDAAFHETRKRAKRLRYAAEPAVPLFGSPVKVLVRAAKQVQEVLGERQDAAVAQVLLREYAAEAGFDLESSVLTALLAIEETRMAEHEAAFLRRWNQGGYPLTLR